MYRLILAVIATICCCGCEVKSKTSSEENSANDRESVVTLNAEPNADDKNGVTSEAAPVEPEAANLVGLTDAAATKVRELLAACGSSYLRVGISREADDMTFLNYVLQLEDEKLAIDVLTESAGVKILVDRESTKYIKGTTIDWKSNDAGEGFVFNNPNAPADDE